MQREDAYTYAQSEKGVPSARAELEACKAAGLAVDWVDEADVPFPFDGGVRLAHQAQFDPMPLLDSLIVELDERGGRLAQGVRVQKVSGDGDGLALHVRTSAGDEFDVHANTCVLATGIPILDRGGFFARLKPNRSYCMAYKVPGNMTRGMYLSADSPTRSMRYAPTAEGDRLIVGGAGHPAAMRRARRRPSRNSTHGRRCITPAQCKPTIGPRRTMHRSTNSPMSVRFSRGRDGQHRTDAAFHLYARGARDYAP